MYDSYGDAIQHESNKNQTTGTYPPKRKSPPPTNSKKNTNPWYTHSKKSTYSINQLRRKAQQIYGISNPSFVKKQDFSGVTNAAVVEEMKWLNNLHSCSGMTEQPTEITDQPLGIWDDSIIVFVKDLDEENKTQTLSAVELAEFRKQEAIRIGKMKNKNNQNSYSRPERKLEIKDDRWEKRNQLEIQKEIDAKKTKQGQALSIEEVE